jgi:hypothetical protein
MKIVSRIGVPASLVGSIRMSLSDFMTLHKITYQHLNPALKEGVDK